MADFNQLLAQRFNKRAAALLGIAEQPGISSVAPEVMPIADINSLRHEELLLGEESAAAAGGAVTSAAGQHVEIVFAISRENAAIATIQGFYFSQTVANNVILSWRTTTADIAGLTEVPKAFTDGRNPRGSPLLFVGGKGVAVASVDGTAFGQIILPSGGATTVAPNFLPFQFTVSGQARPGSVNPVKLVIVLEANAVATLRFTAFWRERAARPEEVPQ